MAENKYEDIDLDFIAHPTTGDITTKIDLEAVKRSVRNLVLTSKYERPFQPFLQSGIREMLFEPLSPITAFGIRQNIIDVINQHEPRAVLLNVEVIADDEKNGFGVHIYFKVINTNEQAVVGIMLERLR
jgi:phage baseplate assembly protein W